MQTVVKYCVYLDILLMGPIYVIKYTLSRENPMSGQKRSLRKPPSFASALPFYMSGHGGLLRHSWSQSSSKFVSLTPTFVKARIYGTSVAGTRKVYVPDLSKDSFLEV